MSLWAAVSRPLQHPVMLLRSFCLHCVNSTSERPWVSLYFSRAVCTEEQGWWMTPLCARGTLSDTDMS